MDGARTTWVLEHPDRFGPVTRALARAEQRSYGQIGEPDVLVVLRLDPEVAVARRTDEASDFVRVRNTEIFDLDWSATDAVVVDATRPPAEVLAEVRRAVWDRL
jgi:thymidylate kinase